MTNISSETQLNLKLVKLQLAKLSICFNVSFQKTNFWSSSDLTTTNLYP